MSEYTTIEHYVNHVMDEIAKRDVEQVSERLRALGWEEVVRCKDCEEFEPYHTYAGDVLDCGMCLKHDHETFNSRFCAWGERKQ